MPLSPLQAGPDVTNGHS